MIRIIAEDEQPLILEGLRRHINKETDMRLVATTNHGSKLMDLVRKHRPDIAIVDFGLRTHDFDPVAAIRAVKDEFPDTKVFIYTHYNKPALVHALMRAGASSYVRKSDELSMEIVRGIRIVYQGGQFFSADILQVLNDHRYDIRLTEDEAAILLEMAKGRYVSRIAQRMGVSAYRMRRMVMILYDKLGVEKEKRTLEHFKLINKARQLGLLPDKV